MSRYIDSLISLPFPHVFESKLGDAKSFQQKSGRSGIVLMFYTEVRRVKLGRSTLTFLPRKRLVYQRIHSGAIKYPPDQQ